MNNHIYLVVKREYLERVRRKSFIITTILMPVFMIAMMGLPALMAYLAEPENKTIAVIDHSGLVAPGLRDSGDLRFVDVNVPVDSAKNNADYDGVLVIGRNIMANPSEVTLFSHESTSMVTDQQIIGQITGIIEQYRLEQYDIPNLDAIMAAVHADVRMQTFRIGEDEQQTSSIASYIIGTLMMLILYMFIIMYGQMVMTSIIEEKNNRVLEIVVSSMSPRGLMLGKILGIGAVALTQILIWAAIVFVFVQWGMPSLVGDLLNAPGADVDLIGIIKTIGDTGYIMSLFGYLTLFLIGGFLFYSALYAAIGSAVDNIQDASQLQMVAILPIILGLMLSMTVVNDPNSSMALWASMIPFTSPMVMMSRLPFGVPAWEIVVSLAVLYVSVIFVIWFAAKIYRVGIFMYGKKPTMKELIRWSRYK